MKKNLIMKTECEEEALVKLGFTFAETTFDSLFVKGWQLQGEESSEDELTIAPAPEANQNGAF
jgi:hypothetical protein